MGILSLLGQSVETMKSPIKISFLITHFNRPSDLKICIDAIRKLSLSNYEIVVSDDASIDQVQKVIKEFDVDKLVVSTENKGLAANLNQGIMACEGEYILYCQEDFILSFEVTNILEECLMLLNSEKVDMIRFVANYSFKKLLPLSMNIDLIPKFSFSNFFLNYYQYSDHPFITRASFFKRYGLYLENTSGRYGETEYAIRILKSDGKLGISKKAFASSIVGSVSVLQGETSIKNNSIKLNKSLLRLARAFRLYLECILYNKSKRGLVTYVNFRKNSKKE